MIIEMIYMSCVLHYYLFNTKIMLCTWYRVTPLIKGHLFNLVSYTAQHRPHRLRYTDRRVLSWFYQRGIIGFRLSIPIPVVAILK